MGIQVQGNGGVIADVDGTGFRALRVTIRPTEYGSLGAYKISGLSGTIGAGLAGSSELFQVRWTDATRFALIHLLTCDGVSGSATAFTAGFGKIDCMIARAFSAAGTGGTALTLTTNNAKLRTSMGTMLMTEIRVVTTAALGAGTKTLDAQACGQLSLSVGVVVSVQYSGQVPLYKADDSPHPVVLAGTGGGEGIVARATVPATGTWQTGFTVAWSEVAAY